MRKFLLSHMTKCTDVELSGVIAGESIRCRGKGYCPYPFQDIQGYCFDGVDVNIISDLDVKTKWWIERFYGDGIDCYRLTHKINGMAVDFECNGGQFICDVNDFVGTKATCMFNSSVYQKMKISKACIGRMLLVEKMHQSLGYIGLDHLAKLVKGNSWTDCPIQPKDVYNYAQWMHSRSCMGCICGKRRADPQVRLEPVVYHEVGELLVLDLVFLTSHKDEKIGDAPVGILCVDSYSLFKCVVWLKGKAAPYVLDGVKRIIEMYKRFNHDVRRVKMDNERGGINLENYLGTFSPPVQMDNSDPGRHVALIESSIGYLKSGWRSTLLGVDFGVKCPRTFYKSAFVDCVNSCNIMLTSSNDYVTPFQMFYNEKPCYRMYSDLKWGDVVTTKKLNAERDEDSRVDFGIIFGRKKPTGIGGYKVFNLETKQIITRSDCVKISSNKFIRKLISSIDLEKGVKVSIPSLFVGSIDEGHEVKDDVDMSSDESFRTREEKVIELNNKEYEDEYFVDLSVDSDAVDNIANEIEEGLEISDSIPVMTDSGSGSPTEGDGIYPRTLTSHPGNRDGNDGSLSNVIETEDHIGSEPSDINTLISESIIKRLSTDHNVLQGYLNDNIKRNISCNYNNVYIKGYIIVIYVCLYT